MEEVEGIKENFRPVKGGRADPGAAFRHMLVVCYSIDVGGGGDEAGVS